MTDMELQRLIVPCEWKAVDGQPNTLEGYASTFGNVDLDGDVIQKGAFATSIKQMKAGQRWPLLADHMPSTHNVLGSIVSASEDAHGLKIRAEFSSAPSAQDTRIKMLEGHIDRMSIGYQPKAWEITKGDDGEPVRLLKEIKLWEISAVVFPANPEAVIQRVKSVALEIVSKAVKAGVPGDEIEAEFSRTSGTLGEWVKQFNADFLAKSSDEAHEMIVAEAAVSADEAPVNADEAPASTDEAPVSADEAEPAVEFAVEPVELESMTARLARTDALLGGGDPTANADPVLLARIEARFEIEDSRKAAAEQALARAALDQARAKAHLEIDVAFGDDDIPVLDPDSGDQGA